MRILHSSDWHIGRKLKEHDRLGEFKEFFSWLHGKIISENIDVLLVAGDIFDNTTPSTQAQELYYSFLAGLPCRHAVIISGNHDSPAFIDAPAKILRRCKVHVVGQACENISDEVITLRDDAGNIELIICAVPYLRDRDVRTVNTNENFQDIERALTSGIKNHYEKVFEAARILRGNSDVPIIAMGHLFVKGGKSKPDDGTRALYVGTSVEIPSDIFPDDITYTALGHLHAPQSITRENIRYSGSPIAMTFGEVGTEKTISIIETNGKNFVSVKEIPVPVFQKFARISGDMQKISEDLKKFEGENSPKDSVWLEITYTGQDLLGNLGEEISKLTKDFPALDILSVHDESPKDFSDTPEIPGGLENVKPLEMLNFCFDADNTPKEKREIFTTLYKKILLDLGIDY